MTELGCTQMGAREDRCPAVQSPQRAGTSRVPWHPPPERRPGTCLNLGKEIFLPLPLLPGHGSGPYCSPRPPRPPVGLINLREMIGVRLDRVNCLDDRRGCLSTAGEEQRRVSSSSLRPAPTDGLAGAPQPRGAAAPPGPHPEPLPVPLAPAHLVRQLG